MGLANSNYWQLIWPAHPKVQLNVTTLARFAESSGLHCTMHKEVQWRPTERHLGWVKTQSRQYFRPKMGFMAQLASAPMRSDYFTVVSNEAKSDQRKKKSCESILRRLLPLAIITVPIITKHWFFICWWICFFHCIWQVLWVYFVYIQVCALVATSVPAWFL